MQNKPKPSLKNAIANAVMKQMGDVSAAPQGAIANLQTIQDMDNEEEENRYAINDDTHDEIDNIPLESINAEIEAEERAREQQELKWIKFFCTNLN